MRTLVYKRTHNGDPDEQGCFGIRDCMGGVRGRDYDAVIGVGGTGDEPRSWGIAGKVNWIGIGPHRQPGTPRGPLVTFDHYVYYGENGPSFHDLAPTLARHVYGNNVRTKMRFTDAEQQEVDAILALAKDARPSPALSGVPTVATNTRPPAPLRSAPVPRRRAPC
jgi:hypothetical protein